MQKSRRSRDWFLWTFLRFCSVDKVQKHKMRPNKKRSKKFRYPGVNWSMPYLHSSPAIKLKGLCLPFLDAIFRHDDVQNFLDCRTPKKESHCPKQVQSSERIHPPALKARKVMKKASLVIGQELWTELDWSRLGHPRSNLSPCLCISSIMYSTGSSLSLSLLLH